MKSRYHSFPSLLAAIVGGALLGGFGPSPKDAGGGEPPSPESRQTPATRTSAASSVVGNASERELKGTARVSAAYAGAWEILKDGKVDSSIRVVLQQALLEEWCLVDLESALHAAIEESMNGVCAPGIEERPEEVWSWIQDSKFGLSTWPLLYTWIEIVGEANPGLLLQRFDDIPPDPVPVKRAPDQTSPDDSDSDGGDPFSGETGWRDSGFVTQTNRTLGGPEFPFQSVSTPRELALLTVLDHARAEKTDASLAAELMSSVAALTDGGDDGYRRKSLVHALSSDDAAALESRLRATEDSLVRKLYLDAYADKFRQVAPSLRAAESEKIPEDLREEVLQHFGLLDAK